MRIDLKSLPSGNTDTPSLRVVHCDLVSKYLRVILYDGNIPKRWPIAIVFTMVPTFIRYSSRAETLAVSATNV